jgi:RHS repeat-associated protein
MFRNEQGSATVMMQVTLDATTGAMAPAEVTDPITRNAYTPYGAVRGADNLTISKGWLNRIADGDTGLTYLGARYYDPLTSRFISPDPLMNPKDPRTLDAYIYANNNPISYSDPTGLYADEDEEMCGHYGCVGPTDAPNTVGAGLYGYGTPPPGGGTGSPGGPGGAVASPPLSTVLVDLTSGDDVDQSCLSQYCQLTGWPDAAIPVEGVWAVGYPREDPCGDHCLSRGQDLKQIRTGVNWALNPLLNLLMMMIAQESGGTCGWSDQEQMFVCGGASAGFFEGGTMYGGVYVTDEPLENLLNPDLQVFVDELQHEGNHGTQMAFLTPAGVFAVQVLSELVTSRGVV